MPNDRVPADRLEGFIKFVSVCTPLQKDEALFRVLARHAHQFLEFVGLDVLLCDEQRQILRIVRIKDHLSHEVPVEEIPASEMELMRRVLETGATSNVGALICMPMESAGRMVGALCLTARSEQYTDQEVRLVYYLADYLAQTLVRLAHGNGMAGPADSLPSAVDVRSIHAVSLRMSYLAQHDALTDLPNRLLLNDRLARALALSIRYQRRLAVLFLDLDGFKDINDSLGHAAGDQVLRQISDRLVKCVRSSDTVSRIGGDEFVVLLAELERPEDAGISAGKIMAAVAAPLNVGGHEVQVTLSIGVSIYPGDGEDAEALIQNADTAMYHAKAEGLGKCRFFADDMNALALGRRALEEGLRQALQRHEFVLHYRPRVDLDTRAIIGSEALIRWLHPQHGLLFPAQFLPIAEQRGLMAPIGQWVLAETCRQARAWMESGLPELPVSVNISSMELLAKDFLENVHGILEQSRLPANCLELEVPEGVLMKQTGSTKAILLGLSAMGVGLTVDHFGAAHSSLSALTQLPIDALKIDRSFIQQLNSGSNGTFSQGAGRVISTLIGLGRCLGHRVIAEGVETSEQLAFLQAQHCREGQGNYFSPALSAEEFTKVRKREFKRNIQNSV